MEMVRNGAYGSSGASCDSLAGDGGTMEHCEVDMGDGVDVGMGGDTAMETDDVVMVTNRSYTSSTIIGELDNSTTTVKAGEQDGSDGEAEWAEIL
jgi:myosin-crossreactive antigen